MPSHRHVRVYLVNKRLRYFVNKKEQIRIVIEHGKAGVPAEAFVKIIQRTLKLLRGLDRAIDAGATKRDWTISHASMSSPLHLSFDAPPRIAPCQTDRAFITDFRRLEQNKTPKYMTPALQSDARAILSVLGDGISGLEYHAGRMKISPTRLAIVAIESNRPMSGTYFEIGSIEGSLEVASIHGQDAVRIWDARFSAPVDCIVSPRQFNEALGYLKNRARVVVRGRICFSNRRPIRVESVFDIRELPGLSKRIRVSDIRPVSLYGNREPASYLRTSGDT